MCGFGDQFKAIDLLLYSSKFRENLREFFVFLWDGEAIAIMESHGHGECLVYNSVQW